jgi:SAM-dependent methyltransferase
MTEPTWQRYLTDYNEGLGLVYERFVLNDFLSALRGKYGLQTVLEAPLFGMAGVSGINSVALAQAGAQVTLVDDHNERLAAVERIWGELGLPVRSVCHEEWGCLPFPDGTFDLAWNWAALWYLPDPAALLRELVRVSRQVVFIAMPNRAQVGYLLRKYLPCAGGRRGAHRPAGRPGCAALARHGHAGRRGTQAAGLALEKANRPVQRQRLAVEHHGLLPGPAA